MPSLLLLIDNPAFGPLLQETLEAQSIRTTLSGCMMPDDVAQLIVEHHYDLALIYSAQGDTDTLSCLKRVRELTEMPVYVLIEGKRDALLSAFDNGADDALQIPVSAELIARKIKAFVKRVIEKDKHVQSYDIGDYTLDTSRQLLYYKGKLTAELTGKENALLELLASKQGQTIDKSLILVRIWRENNYFNARSLSVYINRLRHKLSHDGRIVITNVKGSGYKLYLTS
ncbi:MAG: response regulator transcription factor [Paludibacteraceae bacterium]|nr:response regulator transcription factor [Paludibacteraceae bacterium]